MKQRITWGTAVSPEKQLIHTDFDFEHMQTAKFSLSPEKNLSLKL